MTPNERFVIFSDATFRRGWVEIEKQVQSSMSHHCAQNRLDGFRELRPREQAASDAHCFTNHACVCTAVELTANSANAAPSATETGIQTDRPSSARYGNYHAAPLPGQSYQQAGYAQANYQIPANTSGHYTGPSGQSIGNQGPAPFGPVEVPPTQATYQKRTVASG